MMSAHPNAFGGAPAIDDAGEEQHHGHHSAGGGLVLIKSFKTGSTTLATYIAQIGHKRRSYFLHPEATGWFAPGELECRRDKGQRFDVSLRHVTPSTPYGVLEELVPGAAFVTIMRRPAERFLSLFNFREEIKRKFVTPQALVSAIRTGEVSQGDARPFCNQLAWLMSGRDVDYTGITDPADVKRVAQEVIEEAEKRGVMVLITERMSESLAVLAHRMQWDTDELELRVGSQRVQSGGPHYFSCSGNSNAGNPCTSAIRGCNLIDEVLYDHYERNFEDLVRELPPQKHRRAKTLLDGQPKAKSSMSRLELGKFPINCISARGADARAKPGLDDGHALRRPYTGGGGLPPAAFSPPPPPSSNESNEDLYRRLHSCEGRPTAAHDRAGPQSRSEGVKILT
ncbi:unnamed protein product [Scytosiphon promiscuus]